MYRRNNLIWKNFVHFRLVGLLISAPICVFLQSFITYFSQLNSESKQMNWPIFSSFVITSKFESKIYNKIIFFLYKTLLIKRET